MRVVVVIDDISHTHMLTTSGVSVFSLAGSLGNSFV